MHTTPRSHSGADALPVGRNAGILALQLQEDVEQTLPMMNASAYVLWCDIELHLSDTASSHHEDSKRRKQRERVATRQRDRPAFVLVVETASA